MPKFTDEEKAEINKKLIIQGRELFSKHGIKKVTVDDLVEAVNISKGSYYAFYNSKEELFMSIVLEETKKLVSSIENDFLVSIDFPKKEIVKKIMLYTVEQYVHNPIFLQINKELTAYLSRKLSSEFWDTYFGQVSLGITSIMEKYNITSNYPVGTISKILNLIYSTSADLYDDKEYEVIIDILVDSVVNKIINE